MRPQFTVSEITETGWVGSVSQLEVETSTGRQSWVGEDRRGYLVSASGVTFGRWLRVGGNWLFQPAEGVVSVPVPGDTLDALDMYWGERAKLVLDEKIAWDERTWNDPVDHTHCSICWDKIQQEPAKAKEVDGAEQAAPTCFWCELGADKDGQQVTWTEVVCETCYRSYVVPKSLSFIPTYSDSSGTDESP